MATIKDIADRLGISISTVSKGLNGASDISDELRQTVLDTAVEMGYSTKRSKKEEFRKFFRETYGIFIDFFSKKSHNIIEPVLSMGMSDSYEIAVEEGATEVRVGSALFGRRIYPIQAST